jgi:predicted nucleic acid-binding protein
VVFVFLDASALAKRYAPEAGTPVVNHLMAKVPSSRWVVLNLGVTEVASLLVRKRNRRQLSAAAFDQAMADFRLEIIAAPAVHQATADTISVLDSMTYVVDYSLNATDAVILRLALELARQSRADGDELLLVTADQRLWAAARSEGLTAFNPESQSASDLDALLGP